MKKPRRVYTFDGLREPHPLERITILYAKWSRWIAWCGPDGRWCLDWCGWFQIEAKSEADAVREVAT